MLDKHRKATLGTAIRIAEESNALQKLLVDQLRELIDKRDWLVHRSMHQVVHSLYTDAGQNAAFSRIRILQEQTMQLKDMAVTELEIFCSDHGISVANATALAERQIAALRGDIR